MRSVYLLFRRQAEKWRVVESLAVLNPPCAVSVDQWFIHSTLFGRFRGERRDEREFDGVVAPVSANDFFLTPLADGTHP